MITVTKRNGSEVEFDIKKVQAWARYGARHGVDPVALVNEVVARLPPKVTTAEIHQTMINVCLEKETIDYSRVAARLEWADLRKSMASIGLTDKAPFSFVVSMMGSDWKLPKYNSRWEGWYEEIRATYLEFWQIKQWKDKYGLKSRTQCIETPHMGALALGLSIHGDTEDAFTLAKAIITGKINLPTPVLNGCRNGDFDSVSCCVVHGGDSIESIGVAEHIAYRMTAKKAGIGIRMDTRPKGANVKGGTIKHLGKQPIYKAIDASVKMFTQVGRGGSATVTFDAHDMDVMEHLMLKTQRCPDNIRLDKLDYSMAYDDRFIDAVRNNELYGESCENARTILRAFLTARQETGRVYAINLSTTNTHTPFTDTIYLSNLCQEIALPTAPYPNMTDLYIGDKAEGETAFCSLAALNWSNIERDEVEGLAYIAVKTVDNLIDKAKFMTASMHHSANTRRSIGVGITGLAGWMHKNGLLYEFDASSIEELAELHYYHLLKASQQLVSEGREAAQGVSFDWLPIDTKKTVKAPTLDWESLRGKPRRHSVLVAHMPTESSAVFSNATNGVYPVRNRVVTKQSRTGTTQYIAPDVLETAWGIPTEAMQRCYASIQAYTDQAISVEYWNAAGEQSMSELMRNFVRQSDLGIKTMYYQNTSDKVANTLNEQVDCDACKL